LPGTAPAPLAVQSPLMRFSRIAPCKSHTHLASLPLSITVCIPD
jgi:hypothetical protein